MENKQNKKMVKIELKVKRERERKLTNFDFIYKRNSWNFLLLFLHVVPRSIHKKSISDHNEKCVFTNKKYLNSKMVSFSCLA